MADLACAETQRRRLQHAYQPAHRVRTPLPPLLSAQPMAQWQHFVVGGYDQPPLCPFPLELPAPRPSLPVFPVFPVLPVLPVFPVPVPVLPVFPVPVPVLPVPAWPAPCPPPLLLAL